MKEFRKIISFTGNKVELHKQLKVWCAQNGTNVNVKVIQLIEDFLKKQK